MQTFVTKSTIIQFEIFLNYKPGPEIHDSVDPRSFKCACKMSCILPNDECVKKTMLLRFALLTRFFRQSPGFLLSMDRNVCIGLFQFCLYVVRALFG